MANKDNYTTSSLSLKFNDKLLEARFLKSKMHHDKMVMLLILPIGILVLSIALLFDQYFTDSNQNQMILMVLRYTMIAIGIVYYFLFKRAKHIKVFTKNMYSLYAIFCLSFILSQFIYKPYFDGYIMFNLLFIMVYANFSLIEVRLQLLLYGLFFSLSYLFIYYFSVFDTAQLIIIALAYTVTIAISIALAYRTQISVRTEFALRRSLKAKASQLYLLSQKDSLTNINNRRALEGNFAKYHKLITKLSGTGRSVFLVMMDLDKFKQINDNDGHKVGDEVIISICNLVKSILRPDDGFYRLGGDEFLITLVNLDGRACKNVCQKILNSIATEKILYKEKQYQITASLGITRLHKNDDLGNGLFRADKALYTSKEKGRNCYTVSS